MNMIFRFNSRLKGKILTAVSLVSGCVLQCFGSGKGCGCPRKSADYILVFRR